MIQNVYEDDFHAAFKAVRPENFTFFGRRALFEHFEQIEQDIGEPITLDVIAICCDYTQYDSIEEYNGVYNTQFCDWEQCSDSGVDVIMVQPASLVDAQPAIVQNH